MQITNVTVSKKRTIDKGFQPYIEYLIDRFKTLNVAPNQIPFGMKENATDEMFLSLTAQVGENEPVEPAIEAMVGLIDASLDAYLGERQIASTGDAFEVGVTRTVVSEW